ncbi:uncharacterized protein BJX67DRAFT_376083 [Aspergillus lucknowensis]|uniref:Autophagy-related protein 11 n=1 Tax=Aspergillus lucknowensis TaxID=176173 RepID=A0ABR4M6R3_9EURO
MPADPTQVVISALKDRNIPLKRDEIAAVFQDEVENAKSTQWVQEHLTPDTLLSQEELTLYSKLEDSGTLPSILSHTDITSTRPLLDEDLQKAIEVLNTSTAEIQRQTDFLTAKYDILSRQLQRDNDREAKQMREVERLRQKHDAGRQNTAAASSELAHELEVSLKNESEKSCMDGRKILSALTKRLNEDDRLLSDLERLAGGVKSSSDDATIMKRTSDLSAALARYVADEIYCRLDRLYLEIFSGGKSAPEAPAEKESEVIAGLEEELDSLYPEIDILSEMSTRQQFVEPIMRELQNHHGQLRIASHQKLDHILGMVTGLTASAESLITKLQDRESWCATLEAFASTYRSEVGDQILDSTSSRRETMRRFSTQPTLPATQPGKQPSPFPESEALNGLLRRIGLSFEAIFQAEEIEGGVHALTRERQHMLDGLRNYGTASDLPLAAELLPTDRAIRLLSSSLEADSLFTTSLSSVEHEKSLVELESRLGRIRKAIERLNQDVVYQRDKTREKFLERWG